MPERLEQRIPVRAGDLGPDGRVDDAVCLTYVEELFNAWLADSLGESWVTLRVELDFRADLRPATGEVVGRCGAERLGRSSVTAGAELLTDAGEVAVAIRYVLAAFDLETRRSRPLTDAERAALGFP